MKDLSPHSKISFKLCPSTFSSPRPVVLSHVTFLYFLFSISPRRLYFLLSSVLYSCQTSIVCRASLRSLVLSACQRDVVLIQWDSQSLERYGIILLDTVRDCMVSPWHPNVTLSTCWQLWSHVSAYRDSTKFQMYNTFILDFTDGSFTPSKGYLWETELRLMNIDQFGAKPCTLPRRICVEFYSVDFTYPVKHTVSSKPEWTMSGITWPWNDGLNSVFWAEAGKFQPIIVQNTANESLYRYALTYCPTCPDLLPKFMARIPGNFERSLMWTTLEKAHQEEKS